MGNIYSNDLESSQNDPKLLLLLVRYWSSVIEAADNIGTISGGRQKIKRRKSVLDCRKNPVILAPSRKGYMISRKSSVTLKNGAKRPENESTNSIDSFITSRKGERFLENENLLDAIPENLENFDWKTKTLEEIEKMKEIVQRKGLNWVEENVNASTGSESKKRFRKKKKKKKKAKEDDEKSWSEMWTLRSEKSAVSEYNSINEECEDSLKPGKIFWKTSLQKLQDPSLLQKIDADITNQTNPNMLWRSSKGIQTFGEDNEFEKKYISCISGNFLQKMFDASEKVNNAIESHYKGSVRSYESLDLNGKEIGNLNTLGRKTRLSRWAFLRHEKNENVKTDASKFQRMARKKSTRRNSSFRVPQRRYSKIVRNELAQRNRNTGIKRWGLFKKASKTKSQHSEENESCNCSCCSCDGCQENGSHGSELDLQSFHSSEAEMAPNSEEDPGITIHNRKPWASEPPEKESQRPPVYNPEDYALSLKKWGKKANAGTQLPLYVSQSTDSMERISAELTKTVQQNKKPSPPSTKSSSSSKNGDEKQTKKEKETTLKLEKKDSKNKENINLGSKDGLNKDFRNPILTLAPQGGEMSLRQFSSVTELLGKLKVDLRLAFPSFVQEFVGDPVDGVTLLLELLRAVQLSQANQQQKCPPQVLRRALLDEHSCLVCLKHCLRCPDASRRLASSPAGLFTLAVCIMSNVTKSRIIALELLTKACESPANGHKPVSEALSTLRLRFGEPVRFRFLVGMLNSAGAVELLTAAMKFINAFVETAPTVQQKVYIQAELEQAGFDSKILRKTLPSNSESVKAELNRWDRNYFDVEVLQNKVSEAAALRDKVLLLEKRIQILQEEKGILQSLEQCLKERCSELEEEVSIKTTTTTLTKSTAHIKPFRNYQAQQPDYYNNKRNAEKDESTPAEDEGISSSEQELSQDEDYVKGTYPPDQIIANPVQLRVLEPKKPPRALLNNPNNKNVKINQMKETNVDDGNEIVQSNADDEEETTIDEVIEELRNIVNDAETEAYAKEEKKKIAPEPPAKPPKTYIRKPVVPEEQKNRTYTKSTYEKENYEEAEIVPSILLPQPPRRTRSLVHIFLPGREYDGNDHVKNEFFDEDTDSESSDSLLTAAREKRTHKNCRYRSLDVSDSYNNSFSSANTRTLFIKQHERYEDNELNIQYGYEERNIDEEEIKRSHLKENSQSRLLNNIVPDVNNYKNKPKLSDKFEKKLNEKNLLTKSTDERLTDAYDNRYEKSTSFQGIKSCISGDAVNQSPFVRRTQRFIPIPVKRSQTFHIATPDGSRLLKRPEMKPKPKMGVSGLDFTRNTDKLKNENKYQPVDYKKNADKKTDLNNDRYLKKMTKEKHKGNEKNKNDKNHNPLLRRGSFDGLFFVTEVGRKDSKKINKNDDRSSKSEGSDQKKLKSKSLEKMDDGLDSLVDIVISPEQSKKPKANKSDFFEISKNIGPRTRRSLAESSLFTPPAINNLNKENSPKPPQPAQRTSLTRNNSSSAPLHLPVEIQVTQMQPRQQLNLYNFGLKSAKSEDSLLSSTPPTRYPPDGSSSPMEFSGSNSDENQKNCKTEDSPIYATPVKQSKLQKFFGNPKFDNSVGTDCGPNQKYFESNYACTNNDKKSLSPMPRNIQNIASSTTQMVKNLISNPQKIGSPTPYKNPEKESQPQSKLNFFLGTYQSQPLKQNVSPKNSVDPPSPTSLNSFNNAFLVKRGHANAGLYSGGRDGSTNNGYKSPVSVDQTSNSGRPSNSPHSSVVLPTKVTDSLSGLY